MCGIAGFLGGTSSTGAEASKVLAAMTGSLRHRGPDHRGMWFDPESGLGLAHTRLSIVDVSAAGNQPMDSQSGRHVIVFNGEIYNHRELRDELDGRVGHFDWKGHSDTETLLAAIESWGIRGALDRCSGMFALALWDRQKRELTLARDRLGEKPLYCGRQGSGAPFFFASELKALRTHPQFSAEVDREALAQYLRFGYVPAPRSIYRGIAKLRPGCILTLAARAAEPRLDEYWSATRAAQAGARQRTESSPEDCGSELEKLLTRSVGQQMIADVPLGAFLSGGIDSSTIVSLMQSQSSVPVKTFSIGFREDGYDEAKHAKAVAKHLGTDHTELYVTPAEAMAVLPRLPLMYDEPFADSSQIPTHLLSELARRHVKVALSGDGGDELFGGYDRYGLTMALWRRLASVPRPARRIAASAIAHMPPSMLRGGLSAASPFLPELSGIAGLAAKIQQRSALFASGSVLDLYRGLLSLWADPGSIALGAAGAGSEDGLNRPPAEVETIEQMMALDTVTYLPDDILVKLDRASMSVSLETRVPLLDHRVVEFAWRVPFEYKVRDGKTKWLLRELLSKYVPTELVDRPKMGFGVPIGEWLRGALRPWAQELLDERRLRQEGYFRPGPIRQAWKAHLEGVAGGEHRLWTVLMFQSWLDNAGATSPTVPSHFHAEGQAARARFA